MFNNLFLKFGRHWVFLLIWLAVSIYFNFQRTVFNPPISIHQGAQADRASIAWNYYQVSMNFFEPRVMETGTRDGITPCEFPVMNYIAALCYHRFGFSDFWYRFIMWILTGFGVWAAFDLAFRLIKNTSAALIITFTWYGSAVLCFYTPNFIPDTASMSLMLLALRQWIILQDSGKRKAVYYFILFASLACLIKITSLIYVFSLMIIGLYQLIRKQKGYNMLFAGGVVLIPVMAWYLYCRYLEREVGGTYFLMEWTLPSSFKELKEWSRMFYEGWFYQVYHPVQWALALLSFLALIWYRPKDEIAVFTLLALGGTVLFYLLMAKQFRFHDYYVITLLPVTLLFFAQAYKILHQAFPRVAMFLFLIAGTWGMIEARNNVTQRLTPGNYLYQTFFEPEEMNPLPEWLKQNGIGEKDKVLAAFDSNPNCLLYFLKRRGYRTEDHPLAFIEEKIGMTGAVVTNDSARFFRMYPETRKELAGRGSHGHWMIYRKR